MKRAESRHRLLRLRNATDGKRKPRKPQLLRIRLFCTGPTGAPSRNRRRLPWQAHRRRQQSCELPRRHRPTRQPYHALHRCWTWLCGSKARPTRRSPLRPHNLTISVRRSMRMCWRAALRHHETTRRSMSPSIGSTSAWRQPPNRRQRPRVNGAPRVSLYPTICAAANAEGAHEFAARHWRGQRRAAQSSR